MVSAEVKNDVKTLFFIFNTIVAFLPGLLLVSAALVVVTTDYIPHQYNVGISMILFGAGFTNLSISVLGYCGAIKNNKIMLCIFAGVMVLTTVGDVAGIVLTYQDISKKLFLLVHLGLVVLVLVLAVILAIPARRNGAQGCVISLAPTTNTHHF